MKNKFNTGATEWVKQGQDSFCYLFSTFSTVCTCLIFIT